MDRLTELEAINVMLLDIQRAPVASMDSIDIYHEATIAQRKLHQVGKRVVGQGWNYNRRQMVLSPDVNGHIWVPASTVSVYTDELTTDYIIVDGKLFDSFKNTDVFTSAVTATVVLGFDFATLPLPIQTVVIESARVDFYSTMMPGEPIPQHIQIALRDALALAKSWDSRQKRRSMLDNLGMRRHVDRNWPRRFG
jgi:hypothetical protein